MISYFRALKQGWGKEIATMSFLFRLLFYVLNYHNQICDAN